MGVMTTTRRWTTPRKRPTAAEQRAAAREQALEQCAKGHHSSTPTFRPGETVCLVCGLVLYCPDCLNESHLQPPFVHAFPKVCPTHQKAQVQA